MVAEEKRKYSRTLIEEPLQFRSLSKTDGKETFFEGSLIDCSVAGVRFVTKTKLRKNDDLLIRLDLGRLAEDEVLWRQFWGETLSRQLDVIGSVMWCQQSTEYSGQYEVGTRFTDKAV